MITSRPRVARALRIIEQQIGRAMRGHDPRFEWALPSRSSVSAAGRSVSQSELEPMMMPTSGFIAVDCSR